MLPVRYADITVDPGLRLDFLAKNCPVVALKVIDSLLPIHRAQVLTYLTLSGCRLGLLINFHVELVKHGIKRIIRYPFCAFTFHNTPCRCTSAREGVSSGCHG